MSFPRYPKYKDSGVEWLGEVPEHWNLPPLYLRYDVVLGKMLDTKRITREHLLPYVRNVDVQWDQVNVLDLPELDIAPDELERFTLQCGDLLVCEGGEVGRTAIWHGELEQCAFQKAIHRLRPLRSSEQPRFLYYCMRFAAATDIFIADGNPNTIPHLTGEKFRLYRFPCPPRTEQDQIVAFLDRETAKIDELVAEQRRLIELLKEKRQAVISHAVTKGLNPDAPMKPSGIEWLGDVPEHWMIGAVKYFVLPKNGAIKTGPFGTHLTSAEMLSGTIKVYNQRSVIDNDFESGENFITEDKFAELASFETFPGDLLITTRGTIGRAAILPESAERGILHPCLLRIQADESRIDTAFLKTLIQDSDLMKTQLSYLSNATTIEVIYSNTIASVVVPVPPIDEQRNILRFLEHEAARFDALTAEAQRAIDLLQERRTALISAAVTGQIDVRT